MNKEDFKNYLNAKRNEVDAYLDMILNESDDKTFYKLLGMKRTLSLLETYIEQNNEIDILGEYIKSEYKSLKN